MQKALLSSMARVASPVLPGTETGEEVGSCGQVTPRDHTFDL